VTPFGRVFRAVAERLVASLTDGPAPPTRLSEQVIAFAASSHTREEWAEFTTRLASGSYRDGFVRGVAWSERGLDGFARDTTEREREDATYNFPWYAPVRPTSDELKEKVEGDFYETLPDDEQKAHYLDAVGRYEGAYRLVIIPADKRAPPQSKNRKDPPESK